MGRRNTRDRESRDTRAERPGLRRGELGLWPEERLSLIKKGRAGKRKAVGTFSDEVAPDNLPLAAYPS